MRVQHISNPPILFISTRLLLNCSHTSTSDIITATCRVCCYLMEAGRFPIFWWKKEMCEGAPVLSATALAALSDDFFLFFFFVYCFNWVLAVGKQNGASPPPAGTEVGPGHEKVIKYTNSNNNWEHGNQFFSSFDNKAKSTLWVNWFVQQTVLLKELQWQSVSFWSCIYLVDRSDPCYEELRPRL